MEFSRIGEVRFLIPKTVNVLALTATANLVTRGNVIKSLEMHGYYIVSVLPSKLNIKYNYEYEAFKYRYSMLKQLINCKQHCERYIIYCTTYDDTLKIF